MKSQGINIISELVFLSLYGFFLLHIHLEGEYESSLTDNCFNKLSTKCLTRN